MESVDSEIALRSLNKELTKAYRNRSRAGLWFKKAQGDYEVACSVVDQIKDEIVAIDPTREFNTAIDWSK